MINYGLTTKNKSIGGGVNELKERTDTTPNVILNAADHILFSSQIEGEVVGEFSESQYNRLREVIEKNAQVIVHVPDNNGFDTRYQSVTCSIHPDGGISFLYFAYNNSDGRIFSKLCIVNSDRTCTVETKIITQ